MKNNKIAIYPRVSTLEQAEQGYSISEQLDKLRKYCELRDWSIYEEYVDAGFSGSNINRPALQRLITDAKLKKFDTVLVYKLDRLSRSQKDTLYLIEDVFEVNKINFVSLSENFDTSTPFGKAMIGILSVFAQLEREQIKERMTMGKLGRAKNGKATGWHFSPFGYSYNKETGNYELDPTQALIVKQIFNDYLSGISITKLRDKLNNEGHIAKEIPWSYRTIRQTLDNPTYAGFVKYKEHIFEGNHEPIISKSIFDEVQIELVKRQKEAYEKNNNPRPFQSKYMLAGIGKCGYCGAPLKSMLGTIRKDGSRDKKYACYNRHPKKTKGVTTYNNNEKCNSPFYFMEDIEAKVIDEIAKLQNDHSLIDEIIDVNNSNGDKISDRDALEKRLFELDSKIKKLSDLYMNDFLTLDELKQKTEAFQSEQNNIRLKIEHSNNNPGINIKKIKSMLNKKSNIKNLSYDEQKIIVNTLIKKVEVTENKINIFWVF